MNRPPAGFGWVFPVEGARGALVAVFFAGAGFCALLAEGFESAVAAATESSESVTITLRMDPRMLARIKRLARSRCLNYQSMIKQWLSERMENELRER